jgi:two-component system chemotaxis response regulator CheY
MNLSELKILVVDDFRMMRTAIKNILKELHYLNIDEAEDGHIALKMLQKNQYDLVLTDWNMPVMNGLELVMAIKKDDNLSHIPVVMVSAEMKKERVIDAVKAGASGYILKPFNAATLNDNLKRVSGRRNSSP